MPRDTSSWRLPWARLKRCREAVNIVPGTVHVTLDVRHPSDHSRHAAVARLLTRAEQMAASRGVTVRAQQMSEQASVPMNAALCGGLMEAAELAGYEAIAMFSGAGHDAMILAPKVPTTMLFVRSPGGLESPPGRRRAGRGC